MSLSTQTHIPVLNNNARYFYQKTSTVCLHPHIHGYILNPVIAETKRSKASILFLKQDLPQAPLGGRAAVGFLIRSSVFRWSPFLPSSSVRSSSHFHYVFRSALSLSLSLAVATCSAHCCNAHLTVFLFLSTSSVIYWSQDVLPFYASFLVSWTWDGITKQWSLTQIQPTPR